MSTIKIIVALDCSEMNQAIAIADKLSPDYCRIKVGKELFTLYGPQIVQALHQRGFEVFLDLKFHDIPNTVYNAVKAAAKLKVWMVNVHASGGRDMLLKARLAIDESVHKPLLIAVTVLTSLNDQDMLEIGWQSTVADQVSRLACMGYECGLDGVVCSALEAKAIKNATSSTFMTVTPGIRLTTDRRTDDQVRIMTPKMAIANQSDYLVIGRPITTATDPLGVLKTIINDINA